jgi:hypothetical protein
MPMPMEFETAWEKIIHEKVDTSSDLVVLTKADIESTTGNELRLMAKVDFSADLPAALREHGYFILPVKNGEYVLIRGNGYHVLESLPEPPTVFRPQLDFELETLGVGDSESQHLDYSFNVGLIEHFASTSGLRQTIRNRKRMPAIDFSVGNVGPIHVSAGVQVEVDLGCEGRNDVVLIEAKTGEPKDFIIRQLFYPYRKWRLEIPKKKTRPWFFCSQEIAGKRLYKFWEYEFEDDKQYQSLKLKRGESFLVEPKKAQLSVEDLLNIHAKIRPAKEKWDVPQADSFWRVAEMPLLVEQGINNANKVAKHYEFAPRQSSYYREASEFLGLISLNKKVHIYELTDLGQEYVKLPADERRQLLAGLLANFPPMRAALQLLAGSGGAGVDKKRIVELMKLLEQKGKISGSTPGRRAQTIMAWLHWLQKFTGAVQTTELGFTLR